MDTMTFGQIARRWREEAKLTMRDVATHLSLSVPYVSDLERGNRKPLDEERIRSLADLLGKSDEVELLLVAAMSARDNSIVMRTDNSDAKRLLVRLQRKISDPKIVSRIKKMLEEDS